MPICTRLLTGAPTAQTAAWCLRAAGSLPAAQPKVQVAGDPSEPRFQVEASTTVEVLDALPRTTGLARLRV